ncbi:MAG: AAA family ATPase [Synechococcaceae cyanobacterium]|nr:AAA family ATPase [Synechococcaceae cyanobacterium]
MTQRSRPEPPAWLPVLARSLAEALPRLYGCPADPRLRALISALSAALERGELELPLSGPAPEPIAAEGWPEAYLEALATSPLSAEPHGPLVVERGNLLWRRWHEQRQQVLGDLLARAAPAPITAAAPAAPAATAVGSTAPEGMPRPVRLDAQQQRAVEAVLTHGLVLLQGGPGTGKTTTVAAMVAAVLERWPQARIQLTAPTGKAAARLRAATADRLPCSTLHRLLESRGDHFGRDRHRPLPLDLVVIDEVSMVDLALMGALLEALPPPGRLVLVGDPDQLPPIAPGALLLELQRTELRRSLGAAAIQLSQVHRNAGAIAAVAARLRRCGEAADLRAEIRAELAQQGDQANLEWQEQPARQLPPALLTRLQEHRRRLADLARDCRSGDRWRELLQERDRLLALTPVRRGRWGLEAIHRALLGELDQHDPSGWPEGTPVLCNRNRPDLGLANGDVGVLVGATTAVSQRRLLFGGATPLWVHPAQLAGGAEPALALTVHKAQGSEAEEVVVLLPAEPRLERRLLYTALTRARRRALMISASGQPESARASSDSPA